MKPENEPVMFSLFKQIPTIKVQNPEGINTLVIHYLAGICANDLVEDLTGVFATLKPNLITYEPWATGAATPLVEFKMLHGEDAVFLNFKVREQYFRATFRHANDPVYKDSCVEFFIGFEENGAYYNFEFNAFGTALVGYGNGKKRELPYPALVSKIKTTTAIKKIADEVLTNYWDITVVIPFELFFKHQITTLKGVSSRGNFYKCGDELAEPHYLCWNNIIAEQPDFHLPQYFGKLLFE